MTNPDPFADSRAVLIGVSAYEYAEYPPIRSARNSLQAMHALLRDPGLCGWPPDRITVIPNPISAADLAVQIADLAENTTGVMVLYYVGHGVLTTRGKLCLTVTSTRPARPEITGVAWDTIEDLIRTCPARVRITILDCCFAGQAIESLAGNDGPGLADITHVEGAYTLTATTRNHTAHVPPPHQQDTECTSFTSELLDLIRSGIPHKPQWLTLGDIYPTLRQRLLAKGLPAPNQRGTDTALQFPFTANAAIHQGDKDTAVARQAPRRPVAYGSVTERQRRMREQVAKPAWLTDLNPDKIPARLIDVNPDEIAAYEAIAAETAHGTLPADALERSGQGSRVIEINMPQGDYKLAWAAGGEGNYFRVTKERPGKDGLVSEVLKVPGPTAGELFVRIDDGGRQIFSVDASKLEWNLTFTALL